MDQRTFDSRSSRGSFQTLDNHRDYQLELSDLTFNFFLFSSIAEKWSSRLLVVVIHFTLWMFNNMTYKLFTSEEVPLAQRVWRWLMWCMTEMTLMLTGV